MTQSLENIERDEMIRRDLSVPFYLEKTYWWAYVRPWAVKLFEREWLVNLILWGFYRPLRDLTLDAFGEKVSTKLLKISCCYGQLEPMLAGRVHAGGGHMDIIDVAPEQLKNAARKMPKEIKEGVVSLHHMDARALEFEDHSYDEALLFFLPHEQPEEARLKTFEEAFRVLKSDGRLIVVEFSKPKWWHPLHYIWHTVLHVLEPYAPPLWQKPISTWLPQKGEGCHIETQKIFGDFYQIVKIRVPSL